MLMGKRLVSFVVLDAVLRGRPSSSLLVQVFDEALLCYAVYQHGGRLSAYLDMGCGYF